METGDHFKNGASTKSQMSRGNVNQIISMKKILLISAMVIVALAGSCVKDGKDGIDGKDGDNGVNGTNGTNGANGSQILSGIGAPANSLGAVNDYYIDTEASNLYGPKTSAGWGAPISLKGEQGEQGQPGIAGNAGAMMYVYGLKQITTGSTFYDIPIKYEDAEKSLIYAYFTDNLQRWFPVPGLGSNVNFTVESFIESNSSGNCRYVVELYDHNGMLYTGSAVTFAAFRFIVVPIPEGNIIGVKSVGDNSVDLCKYSDVVKYYGLPE